jgi:hypothetical protein
MSLNQGKKIKTKKNTAGRGYKLLAMICAALALILINVGCANQDNPDTTAANASFLIQVSGVGVQSFRGSYTVMTFDGNIVTTEVENNAPISYRVKGVQIDCKFQKTTTPGVLRVVILKGGKTVAEGETEGAYGNVWLTAR